MINTRILRICKLYKIKPNQGAKPLIFSKYIGTTAEPNTNAMPNPEKQGEIVERKRGELKQRPKKPQKPPFVKNLFIGKFDREVLSYPEIRSKERYEMLQEMIAPVEKFFREEVDSMKIDKEGRIPPETLQGLKELGLYGLQIPEEYGGLGLNATEYARIMESVSLDGSISVSLSAHQSIGLKGILLYGTAKQKETYLPKLASGEWTAAFCLTEANSGSDAASMETMAKPTEDGEGYLLNGSKMWITNGNTAHVMTVFAKVPFPNKPDGRVTAFIVERGFGGVTSGQPEDKLGIRGSSTSTVFFEDTYVPKENILGKVGDGFKVAMNVLNSGRFTMGSGSAGVLKELSKLTLEHAVTRKQFGNRLCDFALIKEKFARLTVDLYAMESMSYLTAGLLDSYEDQDCSVEAAIVKVFSSEKLWEHTSECLQILGGMGYMKDYPYERFLRDSRISMIFEGTNEILRLFISLCGLQHSGTHLNSVVKKLRNPLMHPHFTANVVFRRIRDRKNPKLDLGLHEYLHPSFAEASDKLELCTKKLASATEIFLGREGNEVGQPDKQINLKRLADAAIDIYAMTAVIGRASRSYCIGVHNCDQELLIARLFTYEALTRVTNNLDAVSVSFHEIDQALTQIADNMLEKRGYNVQHPLTKTFW